MTGVELLFVVGAVGLVAAAVLPALRARRRWRRVLTKPSLAPNSEQRPRLTRLAGRWPIGVAAGLATAAGVMLGGPVGGAVAAGYATAAAVLWRRRTRLRAESTSRVAAVDAVAALAAELRAGMAVGPAMAAVRPSVEGPGVVGEGAHAVRRRLDAAVELAETSGAPLADVLDRLDIHLRAAERARATGEAQGAGALASAALLAVMPVAGTGLGVLVGLDPAQVLLHTPIGAACVCAALVLQLAGLAWSVRLGRIEVAA